MAAAVGASTHIDPTKNAKFQVHLGEGLKNPRGATAGLASIRFNHKPSQTSVSRSTIIIPSSSSPNSATLEMTDIEGPASQPKTYTYSGRRSSEKESFALIYDPPTQSFTLEPVDSSYNFNLSSAPWQADATKLRKQYPQLDLRTAADGKVQYANVDDDLFGHAAEDDEPDADNPFDYRHYRNLSSPPETPDISRVGTPLNNSQRSPARPLPAQRSPAAKALPAQRSPAAKALQAQRSPAAKPLSAQRNPAAKPLSLMKKGGANGIRTNNSTTASPLRTANPKPKPKPKRRPAAQEANEPQVKRQRTEAPSSLPATQPAQASPPPRIRLQRKASVPVPNTHKLADAELDSDGDDYEQGGTAYSGFELDMDPQTGPSPMRKGTSSTGFEIDMDPPTRASQTRKRGLDTAFAVEEEGKLSDDEEEEEEKADTDQDIDVLDLGSPYVGSKLARGQDEFNDTAIADEDEDDRGPGILRRKSTYEFDESALEKELEQAMGAEETDDELDNGNERAGGRREEEEEDTESEEE